MVNQKKTYPFKFASAKEYRLYNKYGLTLAQHEALLIAQGHHCAICGVHQDELKKALCVDHCHATEVTRGMLCDSCNTGLSRFKDNPVFLERAAEYLRTR